MKPNQAQLVELIRSVPGVEDAGAPTNTPLSYNSWSHTVRVGAVRDSTRFTYAGASYFNTMAIPLLSGRAFTDQDADSSPFVLIVDQAFLRRFLPGIAAPSARESASCKTAISRAHLSRHRNHPRQQIRHLRDPAPPIAFAPAAQLPVAPSVPHRRHHRHQRRRIHHRRYPPRAHRQISQHQSRVR